MTPTRISSLGLFALVALAAGYATAKLFDIAAYGRRERCEAFAKLLDGLKQQHPGLYPTTFTLVADARSTHTAEDRAAQLTLVNRLYADLTTLTWTVESLQGLRDSARVRAKALGKDALTPKLIAFADRLESLRGRFVAAKEGGPLTGEEQLREQMGDLYGKVNGYDGRPTNGQQALAGVLEDELKKGIAEFDALVASSLPALNSGLTAKKAPLLVRESREAWDKRTDESARSTGSLQDWRAWFGGEADEQD